MALVMGSKNSSEATRAGGKGKILPAPPFSHIMANNRAIQWGVSRLSRLLGTAGVALHFSAVLASGWELRCSHPSMAELIFSSLTHVSVTRKCH